MPSSSARRTSRIEARITPDALAVVRRAAEIQGRSLSDFVVAAAQEVAEQTIQRRQVIEVTVAGHERLMEMLSKPAEPSPGLDRAFAAHRELIRESR